MRRPHEEGGCGMRGLKFSVFWQGLEPPDQFVANVAEMDRLGFATLNISDSSLHARDTWIYQTLAVANTRRMRVGSLVTNPLTHHPALTANAFATLDELAPGRVYLGIGAGDRPQRELSFNPARIAAIREMIVLTRRLLAGETVDHHGLHWNMAGARLHFHRPHSPRIVLSCAGPKAIELAGELADAAAVTAGAFPEGWAFAREHLAAGARKAGRDPRDVEYIAVLACSIRDDARQARLDTRPMAAWYPQSVPLYCELAGIARDKVDRIRSAYGGGHFDEATAAIELVDDELVDAFTVAGTLEQVQVRFAALAEAGVRHVIVIPMHPDRMSVVRAIGERILPALSG